MIRLDSHGLAKSHNLVLRALVAIGLTATSVAPALAQASGSWTTTGSLNTARCCHTATLLPNGQVLATGGEQFTRRTQTFLSSAELYNTVVEESILRKGDTTQRHNDISEH